MPQQFKGVIGRSVSESTPWWPEPVRAREGAPNVLYIVLDDVGYGQISCFGGLCETPNLDRLAANGLRYAQLPHDGALLADAHVPADGPQPPLERDGEHRRERVAASPATPARSRSRTASSRRC